MHSRTVVATITTLALAGAGTGCGSSSSSLTRAQLTKQANAICRQRTGQVAVLRRQHPSDLRGLGAAMVPTMTRSVKDLGELKPPASARADYGRFVEIQQIYLAQLKRVAAGGRGADIPRNTHELARVTQQLGLTACQ